MTITVIYGPPASGKTVNAERLQKHYGCSGICDDWDPAGRMLHRKPLNGDLVLTNEMSVSEILKHLPRARIVSIETALASIGGAA
jgi:hypothetical protein